MDQTFHRSSIVKRDYCEAREVVRTVSKQNVGVTNTVIRNDNNYLLEDCDVSNLHLNVRYVARILSGYDHHVLNRHRMLILCSVLNDICCYYASLRPDQNLQRTTRVYWTTISCIDVKYTSLTVIFTKRH